MDHRFGFSKVWQTSNTEVTTSLTACLKGWPGDVWFKEISKNGSSDAHSKRMHICRIVHTWNSFVIKKSYTHNHNHIPFRDPKTSHHPPPLNSGVPLPKTNISPENQLLEDLFSYWHCLTWAPEVPVHSLSECWNHTKLKKTNIASCQQKSRTPIAHH